MYFIGTAGFSYRDWEDVFYPKGYDKFSYYSMIFNFLELNSTFYSPFEKRFFDNFAKRLKPDFKLVIKAHQNFTHRKDFSEAELKDFLFNISGLKPYLLCILFQFPYSFHFSTENIERIEKIRQLGCDYNISIEVRHQSFLQDKFFEFCKKNNIIFVNIDQPQISYNIPLLSTVTNQNLTYFRFHGRRADNWFNENIEPYQRYDYLYSEDELKNLPEIIKNGDCENIIISFNNHYRAKAVINALQLKNLLGEKPIISVDQIIRNFENSNENSLF
ncbi:MAG TPA: DUF72 domain-containing protein [Exilispira sp.]|nr:DUF72 domain-containing protein [Exilispira sp.]